MNHHSAQKNHGFSLVELMVAMVVSLILLAGMLQILLGNRDSFESQQGFSALQQNARLASFALENSIAPAGFSHSLESGALPILFPDGFIEGTNGKLEDGEPLPDTIRIHFLSDGNMSNCLGSNEINDPDDPDTDMANFKLSVNPPDNKKCVPPPPSNEGNLGCTVDSGDFSPLVSNVETMQIRYGLDTDDDNSVDKYTNDITSNNRKVRTVRVQLVLSSDRCVLPSPVKQKFTFADGESIIFKDTKYARRMVDEIIPIRNKLQ